ncbi:transposase [Apiospora phragmitis]|uniref:Transposase n=1 Tax=Apiospora phragmitis TaxID=2905665 RepID=A0ABR1TTT3_9PEZI
MKQYTEKELQEALNYIANSTPIKQAAREYGIPESTLRSRLQGHQSRSEGAADLQRLSPNQEKHLVSWIIAQQALGLPPTHAQQWFPLDLAPFRGWQFTATENGWITDETAVEWLEKVFIPNTAPEDPSEYRLLIVDGHGSYTITDFMYLCFSHPVFSPLKTAYRKVLGNINQYSNSTKARSKALSGQNIRSGWRAAGLWPVNVAKPLLSPLLVGNTLYTTSDPARTEPNGSSRVLYTPRNTIRGSDVIWSTPRKSVEFKEQVRLANLLEKNTAIQRQLFRKVRKAFDEKDVQVAILERQVEALQAQLEAARPRKRKKVDLSPNSRFATIEDIQHTQMAVGEAEITSNEESDSEISEAGSCIIVAVRSS